MKKNLTDMKSCFTSLDCVTCCSNDCFLTLEKEEEEGAGLAILLEIPN